MGSKRVTSEVGSKTGMVAFCLILHTEAMSSAIGRNLQGHFWHFCDESLKVLNKDHAQPDEAEAARSHLLSMFRELSRYNETQTPSRRVRAPTALATIRDLRMQDRDTLHLFREKLHPLQEILEAVQDEDGSLHKLRMLANPPAPPAAVSNSRLRPGMSAGETPPPF